MREPLARRARAGLRRNRLAAWARRKTTALVRSALDSQSEEALHAFETAVATCPLVVRCFLVLGSDDYIVTMLARDIQDLERMHRTQLPRLPHVARVRSSFATRKVVNREVLPVIFGLLQTVW
jgi:DNA-binding Lrp family transcriptional regulator